MKPFVALISSFQPLTNVTKNSISGDAGVLHPSMEHYKICTGVQIKQSCRAAVCNFTKNKLSHRYLLTLWVTASYHRISNPIIQSIPQLRLRDKQSNFWPFSVTTSVPLWIFVDFLSVLGISVPHQTDFVYI